MNDFISRYYDDKVAEAVTEKLSANIEPVEEGYVGKTSNLIKIESLLNEIVSEVYRTAGEGADYKKRIYTAYKMNIDKDPRIKKIEKLLESEFNFAKMDLLIDSSNMANAFTWVRSKFSRRTLSKLPELPTKHGKRYYDKNKQYVAFVALNSMLFSGFTGAEITSLILHEVGHNFFMAEKSWFSDYVGQAISEECEEMARDMDIYLDENIPKMIDQVKQHNDDVEKAPETWGDRLRDKITMALKYVPIHTILNNCITAVVAPLMWLFDRKHRLNAQGVGDEVFADSFATAYGYGPELASALAKIEDDESLVNIGSKSKLGSVSYLISTFPNILAYFMDVHPENQARIKRQLVDLAKLMNDPNTPPTTKKLVERDYEIAKLVYDKYIDGNGSKVRRFVRQIQEKYFKGSMDMRGYALQINALTDEDEAKGIIMGGKQPIK